MNRNIVEAILRKMLLNQIATSVNLISTHFTARF